jgi:anti-sigma regulatory factor (Ser/Thr protein kinase)
MEVRARPAAVDAAARRALTDLDRADGVHRVGLALVEGGGRRLVFTASDRGQDDLTWCYIDAYDDVPLTAVVRSGVPIAATLTELGGRFPDFVARQQGTATVAVVAVPAADPAVDPAVEQGADPAVEQGADPAVEQGAGPAVEQGAVVGGLVVYVDRPEALDAVVAASSAVAQRLAADLRRARRSIPGTGAGTGTGPSGPPARRDGAVTLHVDHAAGVSGARRELRDLLRARDVDEDVVDSAVLCLSEVVTNAVMHTDGPAFVRVSMEDDVLRVAVRNAGDPRDPRLGTGDVPESLQVHGRGLQLVEALTSRWGYDSHGLGTTVWFEIACPVAAGARGAADAAAPRT